MSNESDETREAPPKRFAFGDLVIDIGRRRLTRNGQQIDLPKLSFQLLLELVTTAPNLVTQDELMTRVWRGRIVSPETLTQRVKLLRQALGDDAQAPKYIGLVRGEGYRLLLPAEPEIDTDPDSATADAGLFAELTRRRVPQTALLYAAVAWTVTEIASFLIDALPIFPGWSKALIAIVFVVGFPIAMFLAWQFDLGPGGFQRSHTRTTRGRVAIATSAALLIGATAGLFYLLYPRIQTSGANTTAGPGAPTALPLTPNAVVVLPFVNASENPDDRYISEGLGDELRDQLGRISGLHVAARTSSVAFRAEPAAATDISKRLGVGTLIEGSVRRQGDRLRISVQIIDGVTGFQKSSTTYDRTTRDFLTVQQEIAAEVVRHVLPEASNRIAQPATQNVSAYDLMLLARHFEQEVRDQQRVDVPTLQHAIDLYRQATEADPTSALAFSRLAGALLYLGDVDAAEAPVKKALELNPDLADVQYTLGLYYWQRGDARSGDAYRRVIELNPNHADALGAYAMVLWHKGEPAEVGDLFLRALKLDPMSLARYSELGNFYGVTTSNKQGVLDLIAQIGERFDTAESYSVRARLYETIGELDEAIAWTIKARTKAPNVPDFAWQLADLYAQIGDYDTAKRVDPDDSVAQLYWQRRYRDLIDLSEELLIQYPNEVKTYYMLAFAYTAEGRYADAARLLRLVGLPDSALSAGSRRYDGVQALATLMQDELAMGFQDEGERLARRLVEFMDGILATASDHDWWANTYGACALAMLGETEPAIERLERINASPQMPRIPVLADSPCFTRLRGDPRYDSVVASVQDRLTAIRARLPATLARHGLVPP